MSTNEYQGLRESAQAMRLSLIKPLSVRTHQDDVTAAAQAPAFFDSQDKGFGFHHESRSAAIGRIVDATMLILTEIANLYEAIIQCPARYGATEYRMVHHDFEILGKQRYEAELPHRR